jgi:hypothetical protein
MTPACRADTTESALRLGAELLAHLVLALPDGETGPRRAWVGYERERLCRPTPDLELARETESPTGIPRHAYEAPGRPDFRELQWFSTLCWPLLRRLRRVNQFLRNSREGHTRSTLLVVDRQNIATPRLAGCDKTRQGLNDQPVDRTFQMACAIAKVRPIFEQKVLRGICHREFERSVQRLVRDSLPQRL